MRAAIGELELDQILHARAQLNTLIRGVIQDASVKWVICSYGFQTKIIF